MPLNNNNEKTALISCFNPKFKYNLVINTKNNNIRLMYSKTLSLLKKEIIFIVKSPLQEIKIIQIKINTPSLDTNLDKLYTKFSFKKLSQVDNKNLSKISNSIYKPISKKSLSYCNESILFNKKGLHYNKDFIPLNKFSSKILSLGSDEHMYDVSRLFYDPDFRPNNDIIVNRINMWITSNDVCRHNFSLIRREINEVRSYTIEIVNDWILHYNIPLRTFMFSHGYSFNAEWINNDSYDQDTLASLPKYTNLFGGLIDLDGIPAAGLIEAQNLNELYYNQVFKFQNLARRLGYIFFMLHLSRISPRERDVLFTWQSFLDTQIKPDLVYRQICDDLPIDESNLRLAARRCKDSFIRDGRGSLTHLN